eukprot:1160785-Pelagomonas_calceolata.AAC.1
MPFSNWPPFGRLKFLVRSQAGQSLGMLQVARGCSSCEMMSLLVSACTPVMMGPPPSTHPRSPLPQSNTTA